MSSVKASSNLLILSKYADEELNTLSLSKLLNERISRGLFSPYPENACPPTGTEATKAAAAENFRKSLLLIIADAP